MRAKSWMNIAFYVAGGKMNADNIVYLKAVPIVRRLEYLEVFMEGVKGRLDRKELTLALGERKKSFEIEKDLALGRGNPRRKDITQANSLLKYCIRLSRDLGFVNKVDQSFRLTAMGKEYLASDDYHRKRTFSEAFSEVYPHIAIIVLALVNLQGSDAILPSNNKPKFDEESQKYGFSTEQMYFDTVRDLGTSLGLLNWCVRGSGVEKRQHVYLTARISASDPGSYLVRIRNNKGWLFAVPFEVDRNSFREALWEAYLSLVDGVPGSPAFYSSVREQVCATLKLRDDQFDGEIMKIVDADRVLQVIWSEGVLQYQKDYASMIKSLPPKNEWGRYVVYLKIVRR
jgi:hypothetical protein